MGRRRIFSNKAKYDELVKLIKEGYSYSSIARHFSCDHSSILFYARKLGIPPSRIYGKRLDPYAIPPGKHPPVYRKLNLSKPTLSRHEAIERKNIPTEKINEGHDYDWYVKKERDRKRPTLEQVIARAKKRQGLVDSPPRTLEDILR